MPNTLTRSEADAALCVYEVMLAFARIDCHYHPVMLKFVHIDRHYHPVQTYFENYGTCAARDKAIDIGIWVEAVWREVEDKVIDTMSFDWEFVPCLLEQIRWDDGFVRIPTVESGVAHFLLAYGY